MSGIVVRFIAVATPDKLVERWVNVLEQSPGVSHIELYIQHNYIPRLQTRVLRDAKLVRYNSVDTTLPPTNESAKKVQHIINLLNPEMPYWLLDPKPDSFPPSGPIDFEAVAVDLPTLGLWYITTLEEE